MDSTGEVAQATAGALQQPAIAPPQRESVSLAHGERERDQASDAPQVVLRLEHAGARVAGRSIWHDLSFAARAGEFIAVLGPNGVGKSTLLKVALGLLPLAEGQVTVRGRPARRGATGVSYLPQRRVF